MFQYNIVLKEIEEYLKLYEDKVKEKKKQNR